MGFSIVQETGELSHIALSGRLDAVGVEAVEQAFLAHTASRHCLRSSISLRLRFSHPWVFGC